MLDWLHIVPKHTDEPITFTTRSSTEPRPFNLRDPRPLWIVLDIWYLWNSTVAQMRAWVPSFNLQHESSLYIVWLGHNLQKSLADFREITPKIATACVNCSTKLFSWQHFWCLYCVEKKRKSSFYCSHSSFKPHGGRMESKMKKRGMEDLIAVKLQLLHGVSYLILF